MIVQNLSKESYNFLRNNPEEQKIPLARDENSQRAVSVIARRYQDMDFLDKAAVDAMRLNPSMIKYANEEDRQFFTDDPDKGEGGL